MDTHDPESLLQIPLLSQLMRDPSMRIRERAIDRRWHHNRLSPASVIGFNPFRGELFRGRISAVSRWWEHRASSARPFNEQDFLMKEALWLAHDYLHNWATLAIQSLMPDLGFGHAPITKKNFEVFVYCMLAQEAVATGGLDYWYLSETNLNRTCDIGTCMRGLTVTYREENLDEYRKFSPEFTVQTPAFLVGLIEFYCTGRWKGFVIQDLARSPLLHAWLQHELRYGREQRVITRTWLRYLAHDELHAGPDLGAPVDCDHALHRELAPRLGEMLWSKMKRDELVGVGRTVEPDDTWQSPGAGPVDLRFVNRNTLPHRIQVPSSGEEQARYFIGQELARRSMTDVRPEHRGPLKAAVAKRDCQTASKLLSGYEVLPSVEEPRDLLFIN